MPHWTMAGVRRALAHRRAVITGRNNPDRDFFFLVRVCRSILKATVSTRVLACGCFYCVPKDLSKCFNPTQPQQWTFQTGVFFFTPVHGFVWQRSPAHSHLSDPWWLGAKGRRPALSSHTSQTTVKLPQTHHKELLDLFLPRCQPDRFIWHVMFLLLSQHTYLHLLSFIYSTNSFWCIIHTQGCPDLRISFTIDCKSSFSWTRSMLLSSAPFHTPLCFSFSPTRLV